MNKQPEALRLAAHAEANIQFGDMKLVAAKLRLLHNVNQELLSALTALLPVLDKAWDFDGDVFGRLHNDAVDADANARKAIAKAEGEQK